MAVAPPTIQIPNGAGGMVDLTPREIQLRMERYRVVNQFVPEPSSWVLLATATACVAVIAKIVCPKDGDVLCIVEIGEAKR